MFTLTVSDKFNLVCKLTSHEDRYNTFCGRNYTVEVDITGETLDDRNMLVDFSIVKDALRAAVLILDYKYIERVLKEDNPTVEYLARWFYQTLSPAFTVSSVCIWESDTSRATYRRYRR